MKEQKAAKPISAVEIPGRSAGRVAGPHTTETTMHTDAQIRKAGGRLSREDQRRLGDILQRVYDDVIRQGVPDRFKNLLNELGEPKHKSDDGKEAAHDDERGQDDEPKRVVTAKGGDHPSKGSH
jgi:Anti-sigma factor NepR